MTFLKSLLARIRAFVYESQEFTLWLPGMVLLAVIGYVLLGGVARIGDDGLAWLAELPALCAYAAAWLGCGWLIVRLYLHDLPPDRERELHSAAERGDSGARWVLVFHRVQMFAALGLALAFFWPPR